MKNTERISYTSTVPESITPASIEHTMQKTKISIARILAVDDNRNRALAIIPANDDERLITLKRDLTFKEMQIANRLSPKTLAKLLKAA